MTHTALSGSFVITSTQSTMKRSPPQDRELSDYSRELLSVGERFIVDCVEVIINDPLNAV